MKVVTVSKIKVTDLNKLIDAGFIVIIANSKKAAV